MARPTGLSLTNIAAVRTVSGLIAADSATLTDANIAPTAGVDCTGYDTIFVGVEITAGTGPTATIEPLFRDDDAADGSRWKRIAVGSGDGVTVAAAASITTGALGNTTAFFEMKVFGRPNVFLRINAVANATSTTAISILAMPGKPRVARDYRRG